MTVYHVVVGKTPLCQLPGLCNKLGPKHTCGHTSKKSAEATVAQIREVLKGDARAVKGDCPA